MEVAADLQPHHRRLPLRGQRRLKVQQAQVQLVGVVDRVLEGPGRRRRVQVRVRDPRARGRVRDGRDRNAQLGAVELQVRQALAARQLLDPRPLLQLYARPVSTKGPPGRPVRRDSRITSIS